MSVWAHILNIEKKRTFVINSDLIDDDTSLLEKVDVCPCETGRVRVRDIPKWTRLWKDLPELRGAGWGDF